MAEQLLEASRLTASHGGPVIRDVSLDVEAGELVTVIGANGAGKSTLLRTLFGGIRPTAGRVHYRGQDVTGHRPHRLARHGAILVGEGRPVFKKLTVRENLALGVRASGNRAVVADTDVLDLFPVLGQRLDQAAGSLSGGEQQMLVIARGLAANPRLIAIDEPSFGLAPTILETVGEALREVVAMRALGVLLVEQNAAFALSIADRGYVMEMGQVRFEGLAAQLRDEPAVRQAYLSV